MGNYKRKSNRKLVFTEELLEHIRKRLSQGESKRQVANSLGINESTLRKRLKLVGVQCNYYLVVWLSSRKKHLLRR